MDLKNRIIKSKEIRGEKTSLNYNKTKEKEREKGLSKELTEENKSDRIIHVAREQEKDEKYFEN